jgi:hypothetical protein
MNLTQQGKRGRRPGAMQPDRRLTIYGRKVQMMTSECSDGLVRVMGPAGYLRTATRPALRGGVRMRPAIGDMGCSPTLYGVSTHYALPLPCPKNTA